MKEICYKEYYNKVYGSWIGRVVRDFVGAPVELKDTDFIQQKYGYIIDFPEYIDLNYVNDDEMYEIVALIPLEKNRINLDVEDIAFEVEKTN